MPHKNFQEKEFGEKAAEMAEAFAIDNAKGFFGEADPSQIPIDGLSCYVQQTWQSIKDQKEINIPDQRAMVANYRCNEIKEDALKLVQSKIQDLMAKPSDQFKT